MKKLVSIAVLAVAVAVGARLEHVHEVYGFWQLTATDTPNRIAALGRDYDRGNLEPSGTAPPDVEERGKAPGGGTLLVPAGGPRVPVIVYVRDHKGQVWSYSLVGGP